MGEIKVDALRARVEYVIVLAEGLRALRDGAAAGVSVTLTPAQAAAVVDAVRLLKG